ncbi:MAG: DUF3459 domain-containing protein, partial [Actinomycetota bacterium]|nr:DUF3459 domain-containing protein [Actinomycetota bacterium]
GLAEVDDLPESLLADPVWERSGRTRRGRDGCRVPLPWSRSGPSLGFGSAAPWLPQPAEWSALSAEAEEVDHTSMLWLYRDALRLRRELTELHGDLYSWMELGEEVIAFSRGDRFTCVVNFGAQPIDLPAGEVLLSSVPMDGVVPADAAAWVKPA